MKEKEIAGLIKRSKKVTVLTGAGISTDSGIPDFRSAKEGLWNKFDSNLLSTDYLYSHPDEFYDMALKIFKALKTGSKIKPNKSHYILAKMEQEGLIDSVITQNIDGLHKAAGSKKVLEVHGNLNKAYCTSCKKETNFFRFYRKVLKKEIPPLCPECKGMLRTSVILFGDALKNDFYQARENAIDSDLMVVIGSSLEVGPVNMLPSMAKSFIIINRENTAFDDEAAAILKKDASNALSLIYESINKSQRIE